jgi:DNA-binding transcriptional MerR regulator
VSNSNNDKLMTVGELARLGGVSVRTLQFYDKDGLLVPSVYSEGGRRMYGKHDKHAI